MTYQFFYMHTYLYCITLSLSHTYHFFFVVVIFARSMLFVKYLKLCTLLYHVQFIYSVSCGSIHIILYISYQNFNVFNTDNKKWFFWAPSEHIRIVHLCFQHCNSSHILFHVSVYSTQHGVKTWTYLQSHCSHVFSHCCSPASESIDSQVLTLNKHSLNHWNRSCTSAA